MTNKLRRSSTRSPRAV